jgi:hypothetical protein
LQSLGSTPELSEAAGKGFSDLGSVGMGAEDGISGCQPLFILD